MTRAADAALCNFTSIYKGTYLCGIVPVVRSKEATSMNAAEFNFGIRSQFNRRIWPALAIVVSLFPFSASAQTYPISGVWIAMDHSRFPGSKVGACLALKTFGVDAVSSGSLPNRVIIFSDGKRFDLRGTYHVEEAITSVKSTVSGGFRSRSRKEGTAGGYLGLTSSLNI
jgi:hypothetical protein